MYVAMYACTSPCLPMPMCWLMLWPCVHSYSFCAVITVEFEQAMYMVDESDGMVDVTVIASGRTSFIYMFTVTPMDLTATSKFDSVL